MDSGPSERTIVESADFGRWLSKVRDPRATARIVVAVRRLALGNFGNAKPLGQGLHELRIDYGPGYRVYFTTRGDRLILLAQGGDKSRQKSDIVRARELAAAWELEDGD